MRCDKQFKFNILDAIIVELQQWLFNKILMYALYSQYLASVFYL